MSSPPSPRTLEALAAEEWGFDPAKRPDVMAILEPYRKDVERLMEDFEENEQSWRDYCSCIWGHGRGTPYGDGALPYAVQDAVKEALAQPAPLRTDPIVAGVVEARNIADRLLEDHVRGKEHPAIIGLRTALEQGREAVLRCGDLTILSVLLLVPGSTYPDPSWVVTTPGEEGEPTPVWRHEPILTAARETLAQVPKKQRGNVFAFSRIRPPMVAAQVSR